MDRTKRELSFPFAHRCLNVDSSKNSRKRQQVLNFVRSVATVPALSRQCMHAGHQDVAYDARVRGHSDSGHRPHIINRSWLHTVAVLGVSRAFFLLSLGSSLWPFVVVGREIEQRRCRLVHG
jgi:hypothetical protein